MFSPFSNESDSNHTHEAEETNSASTAPRFTFRPPELAESVVVTNPFVRQGPRLRSMEFFCRELSS